MLTLRKALPGTGHSLQMGCFRRALVLLVPAWSQAQSRLGPQRASAVAPVAARYASAQHDRLMRLIGPPGLLSPSMRGRSVAWDGGLSNRPAGQSHTPVQETPAEAVVGWQPAVNVWGLCSAQWVSHTGSHL